MNDRTRDVVIGLGNPLLGDDGVGLVALERLRDQWNLPTEVELVDGGTWGMNLLPLIESAGRILFLDAIRNGKPVGTEVVLHDEEIPRHVALKVSPHQIDLRDVLAVAQFRGTIPPEMVAVGLQPEQFEFGADLTPAALAGIDRVVVLAIEQLRSWGHTCSAREPHATSTHEVALGA